MTLFVFFICVTAGLSSSGWRGGMVGSGVGLILGLIAGWLLFAVEVFFVGSVLRLCLRRGWLVVEESSAE
jgi:hypothetical protein